MRERASKRIQKRWDEGEEKTANTQLEKEEKEGSSKYGLWFVALIAIIFLFFALSFLFSIPHCAFLPAIACILCLFALIYRRDYSR